MRKVAVILGAGASADAWNETGPPVHAGWSPPLASELFGRRETFWSVLQGYPGARVLAAELGELSRTGGNIEAKLNEYANHSNEQIRNHFKEVPAYLRDLINKVVSTYTEGENPGSHLRLVLNLFSAGIQFAFIVLNYDDYVELALAQYDPRFAIFSMSDYVAKDRPAIVCKVHGSVDWGVPMDDASDWWKAILRFDLEKTRGRIVLEKSRKPTPSWTHDGKPLYPVLTAPLAGKGHMDLVCPRDHLDALRSFLHDCRDYLFIGTSMQDEDLLAYLRESVEHVSTVHVVNGDQQQAEKSFMKLIHVCPRFAGDSPSGRVFYRGGFRQYLGSEEFQRFLAV